MWAVDMQLYIKNKGYSEGFDTQKLKNWYKITKTLYKQENMIYMRYFEARTEKIHPYIKKKGLL